MLPANLLTYRRDPPHWEAPSRVLISENAHISRGLFYFQRHSGQGDVWDAGCGLAVASVQAQQPFLARATACTGRLKCRKAVVQKAEFLLCIADPLLCTPRSLLRLAGRLAICLHDHPQPATPAVDLGCRSESWKLVKLRRPCTRMVSSGAMKYGMF